MTKRWNVVRVILGSLAMMAVGCEDDSLDDEALRSSSEEVGEARGTPIAGEAGEAAVTPGAQCIPDASCVDGLRCLECGAYGGPCVEICEPIVTPPPPPVEPPPPPPPVEPPPPPVEPPPVVVEPPVQE